MNVAPPLSATQIAALAGVLPEGALLTAEADLARYSRDWSGYHYGRPLAVARPGEGNPSGARTGSDAATTQLRTR